MFVSPSEKAAGESLGSGDREEGIGERGGVRRGDLLSDGDVLGERWGLS